MIVDADAMWSRPNTPGIISMLPKKIPASTVSVSRQPQCAVLVCRRQIDRIPPRTLTEQELIALSKSTGRELKAAPEARELRDVELRLNHMDKLGIDVQILFDTMWIARVADKAEAELALCKSWNTGWLILESKAEIACAGRASISSHACLPSEFSSARIRIGVQVRQLRQI